MRSEHRDLTLKAEDTAVDQRDAEEFGHVVTEVAGREIVGAVENQIVTPGNFESVRFVECDRVQIEFDMWIEIAEP